MKREIDCCPCTEREIRFSFVVLTTIMGLVVYTITSFFGGMASIKQWLARKGELKTIVRDYARKTEDRWSSTSDYDESDPHPISISPRPDDHGWIDAIESLRPGNDSRGYLFLLDSSGRVYAHGGAPHLSTKGNGRRLIAFQNLKQLDDRNERDAPIIEMIRTSKRGGGYVYFRWKGDRRMISYVSPVRGTNLLLGGAIPVPNGARGCTVG